MCTLGSLQVIYHILPVLTGMITEELITLSTFNDIAASTLNSKCPSVLPLECSNDRLLALLDNCTVSPQIINQFDPNEVRELYFSTIV